MPLLARRVSDGPVLVLCRICLGTGDRPDSSLCCAWCMGQGHECIDRTAHGTVPEGFVEWIPRELPDLPHIPRCC